MPGRFAAFIVQSMEFENLTVFMTLDIHNKMAECGKYLFTDPAVRAALDDNWEHTQLRVVRCQVGERGKIIFAEYNNILLVRAWWCTAPRPGAC